MKVLLRTAVLAILATALPVSLTAQTIKMGTIAPTNSTWDLAIKHLASEWSQASNGTVTVRIYPGAIAGDEPDMVRKMRIGVLQAAALASGGLSDIVNDTLIFDLPFVFRSTSEVQFALRALTPEFKSLFNEKGFTLLAWNVVGWMRFFSRFPIITPHDLVTQKLAVAGGDASVAQAWKDAGFQVVEISSPNFMTALSSGMVDAICVPPLAAAAYQWFGVAKNMCDLPILPLIGGIVVSNRAWRELSAEYRISMERDAAAIMTPIYRQSEAVEAQAMTVMVDNGLVVNPVSPNVAREWRELLTRAYPQLAGQAFSKEMYDRILQLVRE